MTTRRVSESTAQSACGRNLHTVQRAREELAGAITDAADAMAAAREVMVGFEQTLRTGAAAITEDADIGAVLGGARVREFREELKDVLDRLSVTRHKARVLLVAELDARQMNAREISELWGFSRQRAGQLLQEARQLAVPTPSS